MFNFTVIKEMKKKLIELGTCKEKSTAGHLMMGTTLIGPTYIFTGYISRPSIPTSRTLSSRSNNTAARFVIQKHLNKLNIQ